MNHNDDAKDAPTSAVTASKSSAVDPANRIAW
jgi:hypothetical protein